MAQEGEVMARTKRKISSSGVYHVVTRGNNKADLFFDDDDNAKFLYAMHDAMEKVDFDLYAYCLMCNHVHLLVRVRDTSLGCVMKKILQRYATWYNFRYERLGHVFQNRYFSNPVENSAYFLAALQYIYNNPVKAGLCKSPLDYKWSSCRQTLMEEKWAPVKLVAANKMPVPIERLSVLDSNIELDWEPRDYLGDSEIRTIVMRELQLESWADLQHTPKDEMVKCVNNLVNQGASMRAICRVLEFSRRTVAQLTSQGDANHGDSPRGSL